MIPENSGVSKVRLKHWVLVREYHRAFLTDRRVRNNGTNHASSPCFIDMWRLPIVAHVLQETNTIDIKCKSIRYILSVTSRHLRARSDANVFYLAWIHIKTPSTAVSMIQPEI